MHAYYTSRGIGTATSNINLLYYCQQTLNCLQSFSDHANSKRGAFNYQYIDILHRQLLFLFSHIYVTFSGILDLMEVYGRLFYFWIF